MIENSSHVIEHWISELDQYDFFRLCVKPSPEKWSLGQVYVHLINETNYYLAQIKICFANNDNATEEASPFAKKMFFKNEFPDEIIEGPPASLQTPQPENKQQLTDFLMYLKDDLKKVELLISQNSCQGKTKHPGLGYFNASEWLQFANMHFRHHERQKKRIEDFLKTIK